MVILRFGLACVALCLLAHLPLRSLAPDAGTPLGGELFEDHGSPPQPGPVVSTSCSKNAYPERGQAAVKARARRRRAFIVIFALFFLVA